jgi:SAM-dependent methyltransferase
MIPDPEKVQSWSVRAAAYDRLCRGAEVFPRVSARLLDMLPADLHGTVLDIGAGSGLTSGLLLDRFPRCASVLVEPSAAMMDIARVHLAGRPAQFLVMGLDGVPERGVQAAAAVASLSMQFVDIEGALHVLARILEPGGHFAFNLWYHHWQETSHIEGMRGWFAVAQAACLEAKLPPPPYPTPPPQPPKSRGELMSACRAHGFELAAEHRDVDVAPVGQGVEFMAMDVDWPAKGMAPAVREPLLRRMHQIAGGKFDTLVSTRFLLRKSSETAQRASP